MWEGERTLQLQRDCLTRFMTHRNNGGCSRKLNGLLFIHLQKNCVLLKGLLSRSTRTPTRRRYLLGGEELELEEVHAGQHGPTDVKEARTRRGASAKCNKKCYEQLHEAGA
uniref:Uncharacterized protein n=1 Tax=Steinernema glaseri TaxID=37863 RepID=A0A1I7XZA6_9BILA